MKSNNYFNILRNIITLLNNHKNDYTIVIWGHSWEIEKLNLWMKLEDLFKYVSNICRNEICSYDELFSSIK